LIAKAVFIIDRLKSFAFRRLFEELFFLIKFHLEELRWQAMILRIRFLLESHFDE
jgi:hypothetical protein